MPTKRLAQKLRSIDTQCLRPTLNFGSVSLADPEAEHRHTAKLARMTARIELLLLSLISSKNWL